MSEWYGMVSAQYPMPCEDNFNNVKLPTENSTPRLLSDLEQIRARVLYL